MYDDVCWCDSCCLWSAVLLYKATSLFLSFFFSLPSSLFPSATVSLATSWSPATRRALSIVSHFWPARKKKILLSLFTTICDLPVWMFTRCGFSRKKQLAHQLIPVYSVCLQSRRNTNKDKVHIVKDFFLVRRGSDLVDDGAVLVLVGRKFAATEWNRTWGTSVVECAHWHVSVRRASRRFFVTAAAQMLLMPVDPGAEQTPALTTWGEKCCSVVKVEVCGRCTGCLLAACWNGAWDLCFCFSELVKQELVLGDSVAQLFNAKSYVVIITFDHRVSINLFGKIAWTLLNNLSTLLEGFLISFSTAL